jgi:hypothetical protein
MRGQQPSSAAAAGEHGTAASDNADRDYITMDDLLQDMADNDVEPAAVMEPEDVELFEGLANRLDHNDVLFGSPRWL